MNRGKENFDSYCLRGEATDVGRKRKANEDNCRSGVTLNGLVSVVCDGMGGHVGGATASKIAVETIFKVLEEHYYDDPRQAIRESIGAANNAILEYAASHPELEGMGSTCVMMIVRDGKVYLGHVGDSRIYHVRNFKIQQLTKDHSYVQMLVDSGHITPEEAEHHPRKNEITNALGIPNMQPATVREVPLDAEAGDCYVLCSDGLSGMVSDDEIARIAGEHGRHIQQRADALVAKANAAGGLDNITVELVEFASSPGDKAFRAAGQNRTGLYAAIAAVGVVVVAAIVYFLCFRTANTEPDPENPEATAEQTDTKQTQTPDSTEEAGDNKEMQKDLGTLVYTPGQPFMTITSENEEVTVSYQSPRSVTNFVISDKLEFNLSNFELSSNVILPKLEAPKGRPVARIFYIGKKAPRAGDEFSMILRMNEKRCTLRFTLKEESKTVPAQITPSQSSPVPLPSIRKGDDSGTQTDTEGEGSRKNPEETPAAPPAKPEETDTTNIQHV